MQPYTAMPWDDPATRVAIRKRRAAAIGWALVGVPLALGGAFLMAVSIPSGDDLGGGSLALGLMAWIYAIGVFRQMSQARRMLRTCPWMRASAFYASGGGSSDDAVALDRPGNEPRVAKVWAPAASRRTLKSGRIELLVCDDGKGRDFIIAPLDRGYVSRARSYRQGSTMDTMIRGRIDKVMKGVADRQRPTGLAERTER